MVRNLPATSVVPQASKTDSWAPPKGNQTTLYKTLAKLYSKAFAQLAMGSLGQGKPQFL